MATWLYKSNWLHAYVRRSEYPHWQIVDLTCKVRSGPLWVVLMCCTIFLFRINMLCMHRYMCIVYSGHCVAMFAVAYENVCYLRLFYMLLSIIYIVIWPGNIIWFIVSICNGVFGLYLLLWVGIYIMHIRTCTCTLYIHLYVHVPRNLGIFASFVDYVPLEPVYVYWLYSCHNSLRAEG